MHMCADRAADFPGAGKKVPQSEEERLLARDAGGKCKQESSLRQYIRQTARGVQRSFKAMSDLLADVLRLVFVKLPKFFCYVLWKDSTLCLSAALHLLLETCERL
jgi:hypothetical protein